MKKALLVVLCAFVAGSAPAGIVLIGSGSWDGASYIDDDNCNGGRICAEWVEPGGAMDGTICCIEGTSLWSTSFSSCLFVVRGPRPPGDFI